MEKSCVAGFYIKLTSRASEIPLPENDLLALVRTYRYFSRRKASEVLFRLKYGTLKQREEALGWFAQKKSSHNEEDFVVIENIAIKIADFTDEHFCLLAHELCFQYREKDPLFLDVHSIRGLPVGCQKELNELQEKMEDAPLLFFLAVKKCVKAKKNPEVSQWIMYLLGSNPASRSLALGYLGFDFNYRVALSQFSNEIGSLLLSIRNIYVKRQKMLTSQDRLTLPLINLLKQIVKLDYRLNSYIKAETKQEKYHHSEKVAGFESEVFRFIELSGNCSDSEFGFFAEYAQKLEIWGDALLNLLQEKIEYKKIFSEDKSEGILFAAATDADLIKQMCLIQQSCNLAKKEYRRISDVFQQYLKQISG